MSWDVNNIGEEDMYRSHEAFIFFFGHLLSGMSSRTGAAHSDDAADSNTPPLETISVSGLIAPSSALLCYGHPSFAPTGFWDKLDGIFQDPTPTKRRFANLKWVRIFVTHFVGSIEIARQADDLDAELLDHTPAIASLPHALFAFSGQIVSRL